MSLLKAEESPAGPVYVEQVPAGVVVCLRSPVERHGLVSLADHLPCGVAQYGADEFSHDLATAAGAALHSSEVLIVALHDLDDADRGRIVAWASQGVRIVVLLDEVATVENLRGIRFAGLVLREYLDVATLRATVDRIAKGEVVIPAEVAHHLIAKTGEPTPSDLVRLTPREKQTLILLVDGLSNKQIARSLGISSHGVKRLVANVLAKLNCTNRTSAVVKALRDGTYERCRMTS